MLSNRGLVRCIFLSPGLFLPYKPFDRCFHWPVGIPYILLVLYILGFRISRQSYHSDKNAHENTSGQSVCQNLLALFRFACCTRSQTASPFDGLVHKLVHNHSPHPSFDNAKLEEEGVHESLSVMESLPFHRLNYQKKIETVRCTDWTRQQLNVLCSQTRRHFYLPSSFFTPHFGSRGILTRSSSKGMSNWASIFFSYKGMLVSFSACSFSH